MCVLPARILNRYLFERKGREVCGSGKAMDDVEYLGLIASSLATFAFLPQVVKTWRTRSANDFSLATLLMLEAGTALWIVYGLWRNAPAIWLGNGVTLTLAGYILFVKMRSPLFRGVAGAEIPQRP